MSHSGDFVYEESEYLALSGIQHFAFCRRQWALIQIEQQWEENLLTVQGNLMHERAHDECVRERRGTLLTVRGMAVHSRNLGLMGKCDVVEFRLCEDGVSLAGEVGLWSPIPVEYKRGKAKVCDADRLQLCAQAMCLEEMLVCDIPAAFLYYGTTRARERVLLGDDLRARVSSLAYDMHHHFERRHTPEPKPKTACRSCSLKDRCLPSLAKRETVAAYVARRLREIE